jgi:opacity protein-like surface antigen
MKKAIFVAAVLLVASISANAQEEYPKFELSGTYSMFVADIDILKNETIHGWGVGFQGNVNPYLGMVFEFTNNHGASGPTSFQTPGAINIIPELDTKVNTYLFGPRFTYRTRPVTVFGHFLIGAAQSELDDEKGTTGFNESNTEFAFGLGGGLDVNLGKHFALRPAQFDYLPVHSDLNKISETVPSTEGSGWLKHWRYQLGVVFKF